MHLFKKIWRQQNVYKQTIVKNIMKKEGIILSLAVFIISFVFFGIVSSSDCALSVSLVNQDSYPAIPGDYVKLVFQVDGITDSSCGDLNFELLEKYPISFDGGTEKKVSLKSGTFVRDFSSHATIAYKVRVDSGALDGDNPIEVAFSNNGASTFFQSKEFNLYVKDTRADFEIYVKNFDFATNEITLEILNIAKVDVKSITAELMDTSELSIKGARTKIVGDLDSNEYTTTDFEISPKQTTIPLKIHYTDSAGFRRTAEESVSFVPGFFEGRKTDKKTTSSWTYIIWIVVVAGIAYFFYKRKKTKKK